MPENENTIWSKTPSELTVAETITYTCVATAAAIAVTAGSLMAIGGIIAVKDKLHARKVRKAMKIVKESE